MPDSNERLQKGIALVGRLLGSDAGRTTPMSDEFRRFTIEHLFGDVWQGEEPEQRLHFRGAKNLGIPREKLEAMIAHVGHYAGWPVAVGAFRVLEEVWPAAAK